MVYRTFDNQPIAAALLVLTLLSLAGLALGQIQIRGIRLGVAGVLFAGIVFGHFRVTLPPELLGFVRDFGLILFVYTVGIQVGPGFFTSLRRHGLALNGLAAAIVIGGAGLTVVGARLLRVDMAAAVGIFAGATTNTPSLGAAQEALKLVAGTDLARAGMPALGYAVAYPFGIIGIVMAMLVLRAALRIRPEEESKAFTLEQEAEQTPLQRMNIRVTNRNLNGLKLHDLPGRSWPARAPCCTRAMCCWRWVAPQACASFVSSWTRRAPKTSWRCRAMSLSRAAW